MKSAIKKNNSKPKLGAPEETVQDEVTLFKQLQKDFTSQYEKAFPDRLALKTVVIVPSFTLDQEILRKVKGVVHYEERMLCLLMLLRMPNTHVVYVSSMPIDPVIIDYYLHLLPGITGYHAQQRLTLLSCSDASPKSLTEKILCRPRLIERIKRKIAPGHQSHMACFNVTELERKLAVKLSLPIFGCDPDLLYVGSKSMGRKLFKKCGILVPEGIEDITSEAEVINALVGLKKDNPKLTRAVVKLNEGFSGEGNAIFDFSGAPVSDRSLKSWIKKQLPIRLTPVADKVSYQQFIKKLEEMSGVVESFVDGKQKESPSVQSRIDPLGNIDIVSTHNQILGGKDNQVFIGATFPASPGFAKEIGEMGMKVSKELLQYGVLGRFSIDFISVKEKKGWKHYAIEINLRKGGTTHPLLMLEYLTDGRYNAADGKYYTASGQERYYLSSDNVQSDDYKGLTPHDLIDIAMCNSLMYDGTQQEGVMFHLISTLSQYGKIGVVCIGSTPERAKGFYEKILKVLDAEASCG